MRSRRRVASLTRSNVGEIMFSRISWTRKERWGDAVHRCRSPEPGTVLAVLDLESVAWRAVTAGRLTATIAGATETGAAAGADVQATPRKQLSQALAVPTNVGVAPLGAVLLGTSSASTVAALFSLQVPLAAVLSRASPISSA